MVSSVRPASVLPVVLLLACLAPPAGAQTLLPPGVIAGPSMAGITEYRYPNGLRVLLLPDPGSNTVTVNMVYLVGSRHEGYGESGMAHLLEHLLFIRSTNGLDVKKELEDRGARSLRPGPAPAPPPPGRLARRCRAGPGPPGRPPPPAGRGRRGPAARGRAGGRSTRRSAGRGRRGARRGGWAL